MDKFDSSPPPSDTDSGNPLVDKARAQVAAARLRRESLAASGRLGNLPPEACAAPPSLPNYRLVRELHRGGQGVVYLAVQQSTGREVAVKIIRESTIDNAAELNRFEREVDVLTRLRHPNIVTIHDCGRAGEKVYLVMDYVAGHSLDAYMAKQRPSLRQSLELFAKICDAVHAAHLRGVIHRDLKPSNIRVDQDGEPKILDFGLAKWAPDASVGSVPETMTLTGQFIGSLPWASPEQAMGKTDSLDLRTDVYSLGVLFYQLLTGEFPYPVAGRMDEVVRNIATTTPARPSAIDKTIGHEVETILLKCLSKEPDRRYQSAGDLAADIRRYLSGEAIEAKRDSMVYYLRKQIRRHRWAVAAALAFALLTAAGFSVSATQWYRAEQALAREEAQRQSADQRARETQKVADFQAQMLAEINPKTMGVKLRSDLLAKAKAAGERSGLTPEEIDARAAELEKLIAGVDLTGLALKALDENLFQNALAVIERQFADQPLVKAQLQQTLATTLRNLGLPDAARAPQEKALAIRRRVLGDEHPETLSSMQEFGRLLQGKGELIEAEKYSREVLLKRRRTLGDEHVETFASINNLCRVLQEQGRLAEAEPLCRESLEKYRRVLGDEHPDTITAINNMGLVLDAQGKFSEAEPYYRESLDKHRLVKGDEHPDTLIAIHNMGFLLQEQGKLLETEVYYRESLEKSRRVLGDDHPDTITSINNMGVLLLFQGRLEEAETFCLEALERFRRVLGEDHPSTLRAVNNIGVVLRNQGKLAEAEPYCREALEKFRRALGDEHRDTLTILNNMGIICQGQGRLVEAESYCREAWEKRKELWGDDDPDTLVSAGSLGFVLQAQGRGKEAHEVLAPGENAAREAFSGTPVRLGRYLTAMGCARMRVGEFEASEASLNEAFDILKEGRGVTDSDRRDLLNCLVELYHAWDLAASGNGYAAKAAEFRARLDETASKQ